jgi:demethylmenaquinone methyltransferase/2-methoxy-6-polyprenyl-1,4-benzoquinol methylase
MRDTESKDPTRVAAMFGRIARRYDLLNRVLSANLDRSWRRRAARRLSPGGAGRVLDLCGGTGDQALAVVGENRAHTVVCCDFSHPMLLLAADKFARRGVAERCLLLEADGLRLPFATGTFDGVTVAFGIRNFADLQAGLGEIHRVLVPGGRLVVLEFSRPAGRWTSRAYGLYLRHVVPRLGDGAGGGAGAYRYLARTIGDFPEPTRLAEMLGDAGFSSCDWTLHTGGIVAVHTGVRAPGRDRPRSPLSPRRAVPAGGPSARAGGSRPAGRSPTAASPRRRS